VHPVRKNERANIDRDEFSALHAVAEALPALNDRQLDIALRAGEIVRVSDGDEKA
jgi:hypothetical protein